jgi:hypothetical protein
MFLSATEVPQRSPRLDADRQASLSDLNRATYEANRLASFRRVLGAFLIILGAPVMALGQSASPTLRHALTILALSWLALVVPMVRLLYLEWHKRRLADNLGALVYGPRGRRNLRA